LHRYAAEAKFLPRIPLDDHKLLLDIGCANGDFPRYMRQFGWDVEGVEVSQNSKMITDFKVYKQDFKNIEVYERRYDAITAWAVLEHVHDPMGYFRKASHVLKSGGIFIFLVTNFKSLSSKCLFCEDVPRHLYFFTEETARRYLEKFGFDLIKKDYSNKIYSMRPVNFLRYYIYTHFKGRRLEWRDTQFPKPNFFKRNKVKDFLIGNIKYLISNRLYIVDRLLMPIYERYQIISKAYGIVTYVARRR
jgi:SAM-dependent methyltransferase